MSLDPYAIHTQVESLKSLGHSATDAFKVVAADTGSKPTTVQAAYYRHNRTINPKPESLSDRLRVFASDVQEIERENADYRKLAEKLASLQK